MALVVEGGEDAFNAILYGGHQRLTAPITNYGGTMERFSASAINFFNTQMTDTYRALDDSEFMRVSRAVVRTVANVWNSDGIQPLSEIDKFQHANPTMQRWLMAEPTTRKLYLRQGCDGFSDTYVDNQPGVIKEQHYDYRRCVDNVHMDNGNQQLNSVTYSEDLRGRDAHLTMYEKADIHYSWGRLKELILKRGEDPTDKYNNKL